MLYLRRLTSSKTLGISRTTSDLLEKFCDNKVLVEWLVLYVESLCSRAVLIISVALVYVVRFFLTSFKNALIPLNILCMSDESAIILYPVLIALTASSGV